MPTTPGAERLELRITPELRSLLSSAAAARGQTLNDYAVRIICRGVKLPTSRGLIKPRPRGPKPRQQREE